MKKYDTIFLDRDGTINLDSGYINSLDDFEFYEYTFEALKNLKKITDRFCIITNQSGVARGLIDPDNLSIIHDHILICLVLDYRIYRDLFFYFKLKCY